MLFGTARKDKTTARHDYRKFLEAKRKAGNFFIMPRSFFGAFTPRQALVLAHLLNVGQARNRDGWIQCTPKFLQAGLNLDPDTQGTIFAALERKGVVELKRLGDPATRHVRIRLDRLEQELTRAREVA